MEESKSLIPKKTLNLVQEALDFFGGLVEIKIKNDSENKIALEICKKIKQRYNTLETKRKELVKPYNDKVKRINGELKPTIEKLKNGETQFKSAMQIFDHEQEQKRLEDQRKLEAETEEKRRKEAEAARKEREKEEKYLRQGREEMADKAAARASTHEEVAVNTITPEIVRAKPKGLSYRLKYQCRIGDLKAAVMHCLDDPQLKTHISVDLKSIEKLAESTKGAFKIPGIFYYETRITSVRS